MLRFWVQLFNDPQPLRKIARLVIGKLKIGSPEIRYKLGAIERPQYAYIVYQAAQLAYSLGLDRISVIELGVAQGNGLLALEYHADWVEKLFPVKIELYGFDTGEGLPGPKDYRDLPYKWKHGDFRMDQHWLKAKLKRSQLVIGDVADTARTFFADYDAAPIGSVSYDLDFYSSTMEGLKLLDADDRHLLPRVFCYFDDVLDFNDIELFGDFTGERLAISDFNDSHEYRKLSPAYYLRAPSAFEAWHYKVWILHNLNHVDYGKYIGDKFRFRGNRAGRNYAQVGRENQQILGGPASTRSSHER